MTEKNKIYNMNALSSFRYNIILGNNKNQFNKFIFYKNQKIIGGIDFYIDYNQITIMWLYIIPDDFSENINRRRGYGTRMLKMFEEYIIKNHNRITEITLIPQYFNGTNKNYLCTFYEKSNYIQEKPGLPCYIKKLDKK